MSDWASETDELPGVGGRRLRIRKNGECLIFADFAKLLKTSAGFRTLFNDALAKMPFEAFRWEMPPVTRSNVDRTFECVVLESPELLCPPELHAFDAQFNGRRAPEVLGFPNLGNDAFMVVPCPGTPLSAYAHLGAFVRHAPEEQRDQLWRKVGEALDARIGTAPIWLNTAGAGVAWLHVRLDSRPKYYCHAPYRNERP
ncbi:MAG: DUF6940 family protein [Candidatus Acidiferrales bacterium]